MQPVAPADLHLTLAFLGAVTPEQGLALTQALPQLARPLPPLPGEGWATWPDAQAPRVEVACYAFPSELQALLASVHTVLRQLGLPIEARAFQAHITLGRYPRPSASLTPAPGAGQRPLPLPLPAARFTALGLYTSLRHTAAAPKSRLHDSDQSHASPHYAVIARHEL